MKNTEVDYTQAYHYFALDYMDCYWGGGRVKLNQFYSLRCLKSKILAIIHKKMQLNKECRSVRYVIFDRDNDKWIKEIGKLSSLF